ncbi:MAG: acetylxylan esterase [Verrucomicrobia bacterium]|nr:acetylxylan esterase [Verrucomicrobiota bacterium]
MPWDLGTLDAAPKWTFLERPKIEGVRALTFEGVPYRGKPTRVFAWLGLPTVSPGEKVPAMVLVHGGGGTAFEEWVQLWVGRGYAAIAMDTCGQIPAGHYGRWFRDDQGGPPGWGGFDQLDQPRTDQWTYHAVADIILAHSLIRSLPEVDPDRTGVTGISWGGYLTCIVAGVDLRFKLAVPVYGCGFYQDTVFANNLDKLEPSAAARWLESWDPSVYLPEAAMPILWVNGSNDFAYPLGAMQRSYRLPLGPRTLCVRLRMPHGHGGAGENPEEIRVFADSVLKAGTPLARITSSGRKGTSAWASYVSPVPIVRAELNITRDSGRWQDRRWEALPATLADGQVNAPLPEGTRVYYFNLFDERDCVVSTEHEVVAADSAPARVLHVAADGDDAHPGTEAEPFRTLERARDAIRAVKQRDALPAGGVEVRIHPGEYRVTQTFRLGAEDSGTAAAPVTYRAVGREAPRFTGGVRLSSFAVVEDTAVLARLPESARGQVWSADLAGAGVTEVLPFTLGGFASGRGFRTHPAMELYVNGEAMTLARWPNEGFVKTGEVPGPLTLTAWDRRPGAPRDVSGSTGIVPRAGSKNRTPGCTGTGSGTGPIRTRRSSGSIWTGARSCWQNPGTPTATGKASVTTP